MGTTCSKVQNRKTEPVFVRHISAPHKNTNHDFFQQTNAPSRSYDLAEKKRKLLNLINPEGETAKAACISSPLLTWRLRDGFGKLQCDELEVKLKNLPEQIKSQFQARDKKQVIDTASLASCLNVIESGSLNLNSTLWYLMLLYPLTDNYLDSPDISRNEKADLCLFIEKTTYFMQGSGNESEPPDSFKCTPCFKLLRKLLSKADVSKNPAILDGMLTLNTCQFESLKQTSKEFSERLTDELLREISINKGAASLQVITLILFPSISPHRLRAWTKLGSLLQLIDDIDDMKDDEKSNISTFALRMNTEEKFQIHTSEIALQLDSVMDQLLQGSDNFAKYILFQLHYTAIEMLYQANVRFFPREVCKKKGATDSPQELLCPKKNSIASNSGVKKIPNNYLKAEAGGKSHRQAQHYMPAAFIGKVTHKNPHSRQQLFQPYQHHHIQRVQRLKNPTKKNF